jgi:hypothetical protein
MEGKRTLLGKGGYEHFKTLWRRFPFFSFFPLMFPSLFLALFAICISDMYRGYYHDGHDGFSYLFRFGSLAALSP